MYILCNRLLRALHLAALIAALICTLFSAGERLGDSDVDHILKFTDTEEDLDGNIKYEGQLLLLL